MEQSIQLWRGGMCSIVSSSCQRDESVARSLSNFLLRHCASHWATQARRKKKLSLL